MSIVLGILLSVMAIFLVLLVLVQRGRGGGLAGALGGMGGSSAFGAKAGDVFTRITVVTAAIWIILCVASVKLLSNVGPADLGSTLPSGSIQSPEGAAADGSGMGSSAEVPAEAPAEEPAATPPVTAEEPTSPTE